MKDRVHLQAKVIGRVQGVGFRYFTKGIAEAMGIKGWVRNRRDGSVELAAEGSKAQLQSFLISVRKGPRAGYVDDIIEDWTDTAGDYKNFKIRMTC